MKDAKNFTTTDAVLPLSNWLSYPENKPEEYSYVLVTVKSPVDKWVEMAGFDGENFQLPGRGVAMKPYTPQTETMRKTR